MPHVLRCTKVSPPLRSAAGASRSVAKPVDLTMMSPAHASTVLSIPVDWSDFSAAGGSTRSGPAGLARHREFIADLARPEPRRVRDRDHVKSVAKQPCLICAIGRTSPALRAKSRARAHLRYGRQTLPISLRRLPRRAEPLPRTDRSWRAGSGVPNSPRHHPSLPISARSRSRMSADPSGLRFGLAALSERSFELG
jgi:hypothetical protein